VTVGALPLAPPPPLPNQDPVNLQKRRKRRSVRRSLPNLLNHRPVAAVPAAVPVLHLRVVLDRMTQRKRRKRRRRRRRSPDLDSALVVELMQMPELEVKLTEDLTSEEVED